MREHAHPGALHFLNDELYALRSGNLFRDPNDALRHNRIEQDARSRGIPFMDVSSNDYLGFGRAPVSRETLQRWDRERDVSSGAGASRLIHGTVAIHERLEQLISEWVGTEAAVLFSSGYAANIAAVTALVGPEDVIVSDALNHASIIDGCRLCGAHVVVVPHRNTDAIATALQHEQGRKRRLWVVTESHFSMEGDECDLIAVRALCDTFGAGLIIDEAHALGVFGPEGSGLLRRLGVRADVLIGTLGKAVGVAGAFIAGTTQLRTWLWNRARPFIFSTAIPPILASLIIDNIGAVRIADQLRQRLMDSSSRLLTALQTADVPIGSEPDQSIRGPIIPIVLGGSNRTCSAATWLQSEGVLVQAIRPPTVPDGKSRLRLSLHAGLRPDDIDRLSELVAAACRRGK